MVEKQVFVSTDKMNDKKEREVNGNRFVFCFWFKYIPKSCWFHSSTFSAIEVFSDEIISDFDLSDEVREGSVFLRFILLFLSIVAWNSHNDNENHHAQLSIQHFNITTLIKFLNKKLIILTFRADLSITTSPGVWIHGSPSTWTGISVLSLIRIWIENKQINLDKFSIWFNVIHVRPVLFSWRF